jgi:hypothetical protein
MPQAPAWTPQATGQANAAAQIQLWVKLAVPPVLVEGEDDALVNGAAFQLAVSLGGLLHGH